VKALQKAHNLKLLTGLRFTVWLTALGLAADAQQAAAGG